MRSSSFFNLPGTLLALLSAVFAQQLPYTPTQILISPQNDRLAYIFQPASAATTDFTLSSLDLSGNINPASLNLKTISSNLPFAGGGSTQPWNAFMDSRGNITVITGACGGDASVWSFDTTGKGSGSRAWIQQSIKSQVAGTGPQYLSSPIAFSSNTSTEQDDSSFYYFGGMCESTVSDASNWQSNGVYSKSMVVLSKLNGSQYTTSFATTRNLPIAQAGQSLTALQPTYTNHSDSSQTRQQDFVLLGGHTQSAFINMSQVALWSLPQAAWTYFPIAEGSTGSRTDLALRQAPITIEPRSGHTATLTSDGNKIVVVGGWVQDVNTPAQPQIAILNIAGDYGGEGDWSWSAPDAAVQDGLGNGSSIYGHGAIMLPGDIILITGGYTMAGGNAKVRRQTTALSHRSYLFNVSSGDWLLSYSMPDTSPAKEEASSGPLSQKSQKAGLGLGLGFGAVAVVGLIGFYFWYRQRNRALQEEREKESQELEYAPHSVASSSWSIGPTMGHYSVVEPHIMGSDRECAAIQSYAGWRSDSDQAARTGLLVELPSPTRGLRRHVSGKGHNSYDERRSRNMEVIEERQDQESNRSSLVPDTSELQKRTATLLSQSSQYDPFTDNANPLRNHPVYGPQQSGQSIDERHEEVRGWVQDWEKAAEVFMYGPEMARNLEEEGRSSPSKSDRTTSMLSESSSPSGNSNRTAAAGPSGLVRTLSTQSVALLNNFTASMTGNGYKSGNNADARLNLPSQRHRRQFSFSTSGAPSSPTRNRPDTAVSTIRPDEDTYSTAKPSFAQLQAESESLLGAGRSRGRNEPSSPIKEKKNEGWYGSVKRVISGARTASMTGNTVQYRYSDRSGSSSPQKPGSSDGEQMPPRRATSDASFLRSKRGAQDWRTEDDEEPMQLQRPSVPHAEIEEDWDVERAAEDRVVQLMFTVPRQRLRIVNADEEDGRSLASQEDREKG